jgi:hypothetical protein
VAGSSTFCRNCEAPFHVWFFWKYASTRAAEDIETINRALRIGDAPPLTSKPAGRFIFEKVGQLPPLSVKVPRELQKALGAQAALYRRAIIARNMGHGIGAHAYFRRVVEETMDEMLTMLVATLVNDGADKELLRRVESAKAGRVFEKKAEIAADALPKRLRPGGLNPFGSLHDLLSTNLHGKTDEECIRVVDRMRNDPDIIFKILKVHVSDHSEYVEAAKRLQQQNDPGQKERT